MRGRIIHPTLTPARRKWLEQLRDNGPGHRSRGPVGYCCMQLRWTEWDFRFEGEPISEAAAKERFGDRWWDAVAARGMGERITPEGLEVLKQADAGGGQWALS